MPCALGALTGMMGEIGKAAAGAAGAAKAAGTQSNVLKTAMPGMASWLQEQPSFRATGTPVAPEDSTEALRIFQDQMRLGQQQSLENVLRQLVQRQAATGETVNPQVLSILRQTGGW